jgi:N-acetyl-anhydromuramyl-L-alanine amidase AmpD
MKVTPKRLANHLKRWHVKTRFVPDWDSSRIDPYSGRSDFQGVMLHHTAGVDSLRWIAFNNPYKPVRAAHFLVQRDGTVQVCSGSGAYHAGEGGPWRFPAKPRDVIVPKDQGNRHFWGIEIESKGMSARIDGSLDGMTVEQVVETAILCAALLDSMKRGIGSLVVSRVIRHRDWTTRKIDVRQDLNWWHHAIGIARRNRRNRARAEQLIRQFVKEYPKGKL